MIENSKAMTINWESEYLIDLLDKYKTFTLGTKLRTYA